MQSAVWLKENPTYKNFVILFARRGKDEYKGRAENFTFPGSVEKQIRLDSDTLPTINEVYWQLVSYIDLYRESKTKKVN